MKQPHTTTYRENVMSWSRHGWVVAGWAWPSLTDLQAFDARDGTTFVVHTLDGRDLGRPAGMHMFRGARLTHTQAGDPVLLWIDYETSGASKGGIHGYLRTSIHTDTGWSPVRTLYAGIWLRSSLSVVAPVERGAPLRWVALLAGVHRNGEVQGVFVRLHLGTLGWEVHGEVPLARTLGFVRAGMLLPTVEGETPALALGGLAPENGRSALILLSPEGSASSVRIGGDLAGIVHDLTATRSVDGTMRLVVVLLQGNAMTFLVWQQQSDGGWRCEATWPLPTDFQVQEWQVLESTATVVRLGVAMARFAPEPMRIALLSWDGKRWMEETAVPQTKESPLLHPRWLRCDDSTFQLYVHRVERNEAMSVAPFAP